MKIVVLVKQVPDTWGPRRLDLQTGRIDRSDEAVLDEISERAIEVALTYQDSAEAEVVLLTMGPAQAVAALRTGLEMGADSAVHIVDDSLAGSDLMRTSSVLAAALTKIGFDLVIGGNESTDGRGAVLPAMVAERLGLPHLTNLRVVTLGPSSISGERATEHGAVLAHVDLPAVISVTESTPEPRFPTIRGVMKAKRKPVATMTLSDLVPGIDESRSIVLSTSEAPTRSAGTKITDDGSATEQLIEFLTAAHLISVR